MQAKKGKQEFALEDLSECKYLRAVINETLRLAPPVASDLKMAKKDDILPGGIKVKAGTMIDYDMFNLGIFLD